ncbi:hypothetical protein ABPG74_012339 [Tetrahymena malaccensis]
MNTTQMIPTYQDVKSGVTWLGGPTHVLQEQHIPGYKGHVKGVQAESLHGKTFARVTAECLNNRYKSGFIVDNEERFKTNYQLEYIRPNLRNNPTFTNNASNVLNNRQRDDEVERLELIKAQLNSQPKTIEDVPPIDRVPVIGYQGFRPVYRHPLKQVKGPTEEQIDIQARTILELTKGEITAPKEIPIVGYTGFQKGIKAENMFGKTFKDLSNASNRI